MEEKSGCISIHILWLHYETSFETVTGETEWGLLPLIPANNWSNTIRTEFKIRTGLKGYATLNFTSTFNQNNVSGFETQSNGYTLVNLGLGGTVKLGKTVFDVNLNGNNLFDKIYRTPISFKK
jgi:iron complex outermembrane receptor protein